MVLAYPVLNLLTPMIISIILGVITYHLVEVPAAKYLTNRFDRKKPESVAS